MSNRVVIETHTSDPELHDIKVSDNYGIGNLVIVGKLPENNLDLLKLAVKQAKLDGSFNEHSRNAEMNFEYMVRWEKGAEIRGIWYDWDELKTAFDS